MITIRNKYILLAAGFWLSGIVLVLLGAWFRNQQWNGAGLLLSTGILTQALGFGFLCFAIMQAVLNKKK